jgi:hypothetical protein
MMRTAVRMSALFVSVVWGLRLQIELDDMQLQRTLDEGRTFGRLAEAADAAVTELCTGILETLTEEFACSFHSEARRSNNN